MTAAKAREQFVVFAAAIVPLTIVLLWLITSINLPLGRDQGIFAWAGQAILNGGLPYADAWDVKGPAAHGLFALAIAIFGHSEQAVRVFDVAFNLIALGAYLRAGRLLNCTLAGLVAFILSFGMMGGGWWDFAQPDGWAGILLCWSTALLLSPSCFAAAMFAASTLIGLAVLVKPVYILFAVLPLVQIWYAASWRKRLILTGWAALGGLVPLCITFAIYVMTGKAVLAWETLVQFNFEFDLLAQKLSIYGVLHNAVMTMVLNPRSLLLLLVSCTGLFCLWYVSRYQAIILSMGVFAGALASILQLKFYHYHLLPYFDQLAILGGYGIVVVADRLRILLLDGRGRRWAITAALVAVSLVPCLMIEGVAARSRAQLYYMIGRLDEESYLRTFSSADFNTLDTRSAALLVSQKTKKNEPIYLWGFDALTYFLADRNSVSRFGFNYPMLVGTSAYKDKSKRELMEALICTPPKLILVEDNDFNNLMPLTSRQYLEEFAQLRIFISSRYEVIASNRQFIVYARRG